jgi:hypothetical protein
MATGRNGLTILKGELGDVMGRIERRTDTRE